MKILVDLDGIVTDTLPAWLDRIYYHTGIRAVTADITKWNLHENPPLTLLKPNQIFDVLNEKDFTLGIPQMADACAHLKRLFDAGHDVSIVTARYGTNCMPETLVWLSEMMPWLKIDKKVWFVHDKHRITGDLLIDDKAENLILYRETFPEAKLITIDYPYNKNAPADTLRVHKNGYEWEQIERLVNELSNNR